MAKHVKMDLKTTATFVVTIDDGSTIGFDGGPLGLEPDQWLELRGDLQRMTPEAACAHLDAAGWTRFSAE